MTGDGFLIKIQTLSLGGFERLEHRVYFFVT